MAATQKLYPRGTVKRIVKAHSNRSVSKNTDILVRHKSLRAGNTRTHVTDMSFCFSQQIFLDYMLFMQEYDPSFLFLRPAFPVATISRPDPAILTRHANSCLTD